MNRQLFLAKNIAHNTKASPDLLADGEIGIFGINATTYLSEKVDGASPYEKFTVAIGHATAKKGASLGRYIDVLPKSKNFEYKIFPFSPAIKKVYLVSTECLGKSQYDDFALTVSSRYGYDYSGQERSAKTYHATGKFATERAVYDEWAKQVGFDDAAEITVVATDAGLQVTPVHQHQVLNMGVLYYDNPVHTLCMTCTDCQSTVQILNEGDNGSGTLSHLKSLALEAAPYIGTSFNNDRLMTSPGSALDIAVATFGDADLLYIKFANRDQAGGDHGQVFDMFQEQFIAFPTGTNIGSITTVLNYLLNTTPKVSLAS